MNKEDKVYFDLERKPLKSEREEIRNRRIGIARMFLSYLFIILIGIGVGYFLYTVIHPAYKEDKSNVMSEIEYIMQKNWLYSGEYDDLHDELQYRAIMGMTSYDEDDPYTVYMSREELEEFAASINLDYVGIGVQYSPLSGVPIITRVFKNSPAEKAGMEAGDIIKSVDGIEINEEECLKHPYQVHTLRHYTGALTDIRPAKTEFYF